MLNVKSQKYVLDGYVVTNNKSSLLPNGLNVATTSDNNESQEHLPAEVRQVGDCGSPVGVHDKVIETTGSDLCLLYNRRLAGIEDKFVNTILQTIPKQKHYTFRRW